MDNSEKKYTLEVTGAQADVLVAALDLFSRMSLGQISELENHWRIYGKMVETDDYETLRNSFFGLKKVALGLEPNASYGIFSQEIHDTNRVAWDLQQVIRNCVSWDRNPEGGMTVNYDKPMKSSRECDLATMRVMEETE